MTGVIAHSEDSRHAPPWVPAQGEEGSGGPRREIGGETQAVISQQQCAFLATGHRPRQSHEVAADGVVLVSHELTEDEQETCAAIVETG